MKAVGIGSFRFVEPGGEPEDYQDFDPSKFMAKVKTALESVDNISNVEMNGYKYSVHGWSLTGPDDDENYFPLFSNFRISFDIFMPQRLRQKHFGDWGDDDVDNYHVTILYGYELPITFIDYDLPDDAVGLERLSPSHAVAFIREHIKEKLAGRTDVQFQSLGPSPFHADIFLKRIASDLPLAFKDLSISSRGYDVLYFEVPSEDNDSLIENFADAFEKTLGVYYKIMIFRNRILRLTNIVINNAHSLIANRRMRFFSFWHRIRSRGTIDEIYTSILEEKLARVEAADAVAELKQDNDFEDQNPFLEAIDREMRELVPIPDDVKDILKVLEDRRQNTVRNTATVLTGLTSGIIGAFLGASLQLYLGTRTIQTNGKIPDAEIRSAPSIQPPPADTKQ